jgi:ADP-ribose pyrophosphatase
MAPPSRGRSLTRASRVEKVQTLAPRTILRAMSERGPLAAPPSIEIEVVADQVAARGGFLSLRKLELKNRYADGSRSASYRYFMVERAPLDAVCVVLYRHAGGAPEVLLRSQLRPPLWFRDQYDVPLPALGTGAVQWEVPAGLVELGERGEAGLFGRARAETLEEAGFELPLERFASLGLPTSLSPGLIAEKLHFVCAEVLDSDPRHAARGDGHPVEEHAVSCFVPLAEALAAIDAGSVHDVKTEVALFRLRERLSPR